MEISLTHLQLYLDVTIIDRLYVLLHPLTTTHPHGPQHVSLTPSTYGNALYYPSVNTGIHGNQVSFGLVLV